MRPEDLSGDLLVGVGHVLVFLMDVGLAPGDALAGGHGHVGEEGDGGDGCDEGVEEAFFLLALSCQLLLLLMGRESLNIQTNPGYSRSQRVETKGGNPHEDRDNPIGITAYQVSIHQSNPGRFMTKEPTIVSVVRWHGYSATPAVR